MIRRNEIIAFSKIVLERLSKRPLLIPALVLILLVYLYAEIFFIQYSFRVDGNIGYVRRVFYKLDGTVSYEISIEGKQVLYTPYQNENLIVGDTLKIYGQVRVPNPPTNIGEFDYANYLKSRGITGVLYIDNYEIISSSNYGRFINSIVLNCYKMRLKVLELFDEDDRGIAAALFMGDKTLVEDSVIRDFKLSNCSHLLAVSGTHFSGFLMIVSAYLSESHFKKKNAVPIYILFCVLLGSFTGWSESVTRAGIMSSCAYASRDYLSGMCLSIIVMVLANPFSCMSTGFQMSFISALFIRVFGNRIKEILERFLSSERIINLLVPMIAATLGMIPFWIRNTYYISLFHIFTQLFGTFLASVSCIFFLPSVISGLPFACSFLLKLLNALMHICSSLSFSSFSSRQIPLTLLYSIFFFLVVNLLPQGILRRILLFISVCYLAISISTGIIEIINRPECLVIFPDVGQGDCCFILMDGRSIMIDGGIESEGENTLVNLLDYYGVDKLDIAIATHMDEDHIGGVSYLNKIGRVEQFITCYDINRGDAIPLSNNSYLKCLWPIEVHDGSNEDSIVFMFECYDCSILLTGDIGFDSESVLMNISCLDCDILKVAHHGSRYSSSSDFINSCSPEVSIISVGNPNSYGHPSEDVLDRLRDNDITIFRTDLSGAITIEIFRDSYQVQPYIAY